MPTAPPTHTWVPTFAERLPKPPHVKALDDWFRARASQDQRRRVAQVFVAVDDHGIAGCYSLSMFTLALDSIPAELARKLPRYDANPAALIGRLARHTRRVGTGIGDLLVADAVTRVLAAAESVAADGLLAALRYAARSLKNEVIWDLKILA
jgi:hypothetical protein